MARDIRTRLQGFTDRVQHQRRIWAVPSQTFSALKMQSALKSWHAQQAKMCFPQALRSLCTACFVAWAHWDRAEALAEVPRCCQKTKESKGAKQAAGFADLPGMPGHGPVEL